MSTATDIEEIATAGGVASPRGDIHIYGKRDPIYPSPLRLAHATSGLLGLLGSIVDEIAPSPEAGPQRIAIDRVHALMTLSSLWLLKVDGMPALQRYQPPQSPGDGIYRCRDGRLVHLMNAMPHLTKRTLKALSCTAGSISEVIAGLNPDEIEAVLDEANLPGVVVRDQQSWLATPQGSLLSTAPAVNITRIGDSPPQQIPGMPDPLSGLKVLDATRVLAGPTCGRTLSAIGADVLHVGSPNSVDLIAAQIDTGFGKRRSTVDLNTTQGTDTMWRLIEGADVFSQSYRATSLAARGFDVEAVCAHRPGIVYVTETAYGNFGPWRTKRGFDSNVQAATGMLMLQQNQSQSKPHTRVPVAMNDYCTGYWAAYGVLEALRRRAVEGGSWHVEVSLAQTAMWLMRLGVIDAANIPTSVALDRIAARYTDSIDSAYGRLDRLRFPIEFSRTRPRWSAPVWPGTHAPAWHQAAHG